METVDAAIVFMPRFTTLVGSVTPATVFEFTTLPLDVSRYGGVQFQIWRSPMSSGSFEFLLEESLDAQTWVLGPSTPSAFALTSDQTKFCSYNFRLRWFRLKVRLTGGASPIVTCWAEGLLRAGGSGVWPVPGAAPAGGRFSATAAGEVGAAGPIRPPSGPMPGEPGGDRLEDTFIYPRMRGKQPAFDVHDSEYKSGFK